MTEPTPITTPTTSSSGEQRMSILNENPKILPGPQLLHELISWQSGEAPALEFLGPEGSHPYAERLWKANYSQLKACVDSLAREIQAVLASAPAGDYITGKQPIIPVLLPQSPGLYISQLATLQIGAAFCPINGDAPKERVKFICGDVGAKVVLAMKSDAERVTWTEEDGTTVIWVDDYFTIPSSVEEEGSAAACSAPESSSPLRVALATDLAYIMYTSGSTGLPKGVGVSHLAVTQSLFAHDLFLPEFSRFMQFAAPSFDVSVFEIFFPLFKGKTLVGCQRQRLLNDLPGMINRLEVDGCELTPTVVNSLLGKRETVPKLRLLLTIGEMLTRPVVDEFGYDDERPGLLYGMYGPTEAAIHCTANCLMAAGCKVGNIGVPFETVSCFIAAIPEEGQTSTEIKILPLGDVGELVLGGPQLADGYLNREKENKAAFMTYNGERAYRTGDKGRMLEDGTIEVMGRISAGQVKLRGQRVELGEIEEVVYKQKGIKMAFASVLQGMLIVFASTKGEHVSLEDLNATCEKWLPKYMVPSELVVMQEFPYLPSGKINKKQLEADYLARRTEDDSQEEEMSETEEIIAEVVKELLGLKVKLDKRLASYGLDSLMAIRLASSLKTKGLKITPVEILSAETVSAIASVCDSNTAASSTAQATEQPSFDFSPLNEPVWNFLESAGIEDITEEIFPCTPLQDAMLMETAVDSTAYQNFISLRLSGIYTESTLRTTIEQWADQNPILKTGFADVKSEWSAYTQFVLQMLPESQVLMRGAGKDDEASSEVSILRPLLVKICLGSDATILDISIHHALYDGWSLELLIADLNAILTNPEAELVQRPSFRTVVEQQLRLKEQDLSKETQYWTDHLSALSPAALPNFNSTTEVTASLARTSLSTSIPSKKLEEVARSLEVSAQSLVQAAYSLLLASYLGKTDICFGTVFSGRTGGVEGIEDICGPTLSTLPVRIDTASSSTLASLAQALNSVVRKHLENDVLPLREIKKLADAETQGRALFDTLVIWQQTLETVSETKPLVELVKSEDQLEFALTLEITPKSEGLRLDVTYQTAVLPEKQVQLLMAQIEGMVSALIAEPELATSNVTEKLDPGLLSIANSQLHTPESAKSLSASVEAMALCDPEKTAVEFVSINSCGEYVTESATYKQLNERANQIAHYLRAQDVKPDQLVAICMEKSMALYVSILAVIKSGAGYLPLTPDTPVDRIQTIIKDAGVKIALTAATTTAYLADKTEAAIVDVDQLDTSCLSKEDLEQISTPENLVYAVFTSGSTGTPKGVLVNTSSVLANLEVLKSVYPHSHATRLLQSCSQGFDVSVFEIFWTWTVGGTLVSGTKNTIFSDIEKLVNDRAITHLSLTATVAALVNPANVPSVEVLISAGEAMTGKVFNSWTSPEAEGKQLFNSYGPSETTNVVTVASCIKSHDILASIGKPLPTVSAFVLASNEDKDPEDFTILPLGAEGELCYGGPQVARGYLDTAQNVGKFITHRVYGKIYRTGDFGRLLTSGEVIYSGRKDDQVKIRGQRVELGEISKTLLAAEEVDDCTTLVIEGAKEEDRRLVTFFTLKSESKTNEFAVLEAKKETQEGLFERLVGGLPIYMVPSALIPVSTLPSTLVGKVDKKLLKSAFAALSLEEVNAFSNSTEAADIDYQLTPLESQIAAAVAEVAKLDTKTVSPNASFFALGIDSISAISLVRLLREQNVKVEISDVLKHASVLRLAKVVASQEKKAMGMESPVMLPTPEESTFDPEFLEATIDALKQQGQSVERVLPCTPLQEAMLSASELSSESGAYKNQVVLDLRVSVEQMEGAWREMVRRHEILRTLFVKSGHAKFAYSQVVLSAYEHNSRTIEAPSVAAAVKMAEAAAAAENEEGKMEPPYTLLYVSQPWDGKTKLVLSMHHALYDGFAMAVLYKEIESYLSGQELGGMVSFAPFLRYMTGVDEKKADVHWSSLLKDLSPVSFTAANDIQKQNHVLTAPLAVKLSAVEKQLKTHSTTLLSACQAAWIATLAHSTQTTDLVFGNVVSGRTVPVPGLNDLVAPCFNTIPFRVRDVHKLSFLEAFRQLQSQNIDALPYQLTALRRIQGLANTEGKSLFDSLLLLQTPSTPLDAEIWTIEEDEGSMDLPVVVEIVPRPEEDVLSITIHVNDLPLGPEAVQSVLTTFSSFLTKALDNPRQAIIASSADRAAFSANTLALKSKNSKTSDADNVGDSTWSATEKKVRDVIAKFTTVPVGDIKKSTSIYRLGLDSINAVQVATLLRKEGWAVAASDVLTYPSIAALAAHIDSLSSSEEKEEVATFDFGEFEAKHRASVLVKLNKMDGDVEEINPCTAVQSGMLAQTLHSGGKEYVNSFNMELVAGTDVAKLKAAWEKVMEACEMLRCGFVGVEDAQFPFVMVTYASTALPWIGVGGEEDKEVALMDASTLETTPWKLSHFQRDGQDIVKFTGHHALYDAASLQLILADVQDVYSGADIAPYTSVRSVLSTLLLANSGKDEEAKKFWTEQMTVHQHRFPDLTPLRESSTKSIAQTAVSKLSLADIEDLCKQQGVSVQAAGQAAWGRLLSMYTGEPSVTFGVTLSGKSILDSSVESERIAFPTIVTLPVTCDVVGSNSSLLEASMQGNAGLSKWQFTPLTAIARWCGVEGPMFDTLFAYQKTAGEFDDEEQEGRVWSMGEGEASADYAVSLEMLPTRDGKLELCVTAKENVVPKEQGELMLKQFDALLLDTLKNSDGDSALLTIEADKEDILSITPPAQRTMGSQHMLLHDFVSRSASLHPNKTALEFTTCLEPLNTVSWSFKEMEKEANKIANLLQKLGVEQGQLVAICFDKCPEASWSIIGILKAGCAYVALDPGAPGDRVKFIMGDSKASIVLSSGKPAANFTSIFADSDSVRVIDLGNCADLSDCSAEAPKLARPIDPQDTSYCLYTSGTTGTPKGCELSHENAVQAMYAFTHLFGDKTTVDSKWLQFASFHFDVSVLEQFFAWMHGFCLTSAPRDLVFEDIALAINVLGVTHLDLTPSLARLLTPEMVPRLAKGMFITGGEALRQDILDTWGSVGAVYNGYGPTEATIGCTMFPRCPANGKPANIGPQFQNVGSFVVKKETDEPVLRGAVGELVVSGKLVGKGYLNRASLTAERFPTMHGERVYRTGDLVRITHDGTFLFLGRADDQVKLRGQRLELSEITEVIKKGVDGIEEVVTLVLKHAKQQKEQLVAFFVPASHDSDAMSLIGPAKQACVERLPGYMVPTHFVPLEKLPLSANHKADGKQLAAIYNALSIDDLQNLSSAGQDSRAWSEHEKEVISILATAMSLPEEDLKIGTNIFELGYDSISVIGLAQKLQAAGFANAKLATVMKNSAIEALVRVLLSESQTGTSGAEKAGGDVVAVQQKIKAFAHRHLSAVAEELGVEAGQIEDLAPCTAAQEGMVFRFLDSEEALYFSTFEFELGEGVDVERLERAWREVARMVEVLRMKFVLTEAGIAQVVLKEVELPWSVGCETKAHKDMEKSEALANPWKVAILGDEKKILKLDIFHGLYDGVALPLLMQKVADAYNGLTIDAGPSFLSCLAHGPLATGEDAREFWTKTLESAIHTPLPALSSTDDNGADVVLSKKIQGLSHLESLRQTLGVTYQSIIQAVWTVTLQTYLQSSSAPTFGVVVSGRSIDYLNAEKIIGPLLNTLVFHAATEQGMTWESLIKACHEYNTGVLSYQHTPLKDVMKWAGEGEELMDSLFVFQHAEEEERNGVWKEIEGAPTADYPLAFEATLMSGGGLGLTLVGQSKYLSGQVAERLVKSVEDALIGLKADAKIALPASSGASVKKIKTAASAESTESDEAFEWSPMAETIRAEIAALTKVDTTQIQPLTTLFSLGLDSIDMIKLASRLKSKNIKISVSALVKAGCVAKMMKSITSTDAAPAKVLVKLEDVEMQLRAALEREKKIEREEGDIEAVLPATPLQEGMVAEMVASEYTRYFNHELYKLAADTDMETIKKAWETCIAAHPILRTSFVEVEDVGMDTGYAQVVRKYEPGIWKSVCVDGSASLEDAVQKEVAAAIEAAKKGELIQLRDVTHGEEKYYLLSISHALYDGWSLDALHSDVVAAYNGKDISRPSPRGTLEQVINANGPEAAKYWKTALTGLPRSSFPISETTSTTVNRAEKTSSLKLADLQAFCRRSNIGLQTLGQTAWSLLLASYLQKLDVAFGVVLSCRDEEEARRVMLPLMNTVAVRSVLTGSGSDMLAYSQDNSNRMREFQHFPLRKAQALAAAQSGEGGALFDTLFIFQGGKGDVVEGKRLYDAVESKSEVEFRVCVEMEISGGELLWRTACKDAARNETETKELLENLDEVLERLVTKSDEEVLQSGTEGIAICGLAPFKMPESAMTSSPQNPIAKRINTPWSATETTIRSILAQVSKSEEQGISRETSIFHLGLDSISAIKLASLLRRQGLHIGVNEIIKNPTVRGMASVIEDRDSEAAASNKMEIDVEKTVQEAIAHLDRAEVLKKASVDEEDVEDILPLSAGQLYMAERFERSSGSVFSATFQWSVPAAFDLDTARLDNAWKAILERHAVLSSKIVIGLDKVGGVQVIVKNASATTANTINYTCETTPVTFLHPVKLSVASTTEGTKTLTLQILHVLYDGASLDRVLAELQELYHDPATVLPAIEKEEWKNFIASSLPACIKKQQQEFWTTYLPTVKQAATPVQRAATGGKVEVFAPAVEIGDITSSARSAGVSVDAYILAAVSRMWAGQEHQNGGLGIYLSNRSSLATERLSGPTLNLLPLRISKEGKMEDAAREVQSDLGRLGEDAVSCTRVEDVFKWTGQTVGCWVNILKTASDTSPSSQSPPAETKLLASSLNTALMLRPRAEVVPKPHVSAAPDDLGASSGPYNSAIDIELRVVNGGRGMDVGVFCDEEVMGVEDAEQVVETLQILLGGL